MSVAANPGRASSVILLRETQPRGFEVLLRRCPGGMHGFPCGAVYKSDYAPDVLRRCRGLSGETARKILGAHLAPPEALGYWIAAIRTLFEEAGVLFAVKGKNQPITLDADRDVGLLEKRAALRAGSLSFQCFLESENLFCDTAQLAYFSHWQTPAESSRSFDMRFFLAAMPDDQTPLAAAAEVDHSLWLAPDLALQLFNRGELPTTFPTFASLRTLADFDDVKSLLKEFQPEFT